MGWTDYRYSQYTETCIAMSLASGAFAFDGREYFDKMEMSYDGWHWASTDKQGSLYEHDQRSDIHALPDGPTSALESPTRGDW